MNEVGRGSEESAVRSNVVVYHQPAAPSSCQALIRLSFSQRGSSVIYDNRFDLVCVQRTLAVTGEVGKGRKGGGKGNEGKKGWVIRAETPYQLCIANFEPWLRR